MRLQEAIDQLIVELIQMSGDWRFGSTDMQWR